MAIYNIVNKNMRGDIGFFGTPLTTDTLRVVCPFTTVGGTVISTNPINYGSVFNTFNNNTGGWGYWNPNPALIPTNSKVEKAYLVYATAYHPSMTTPPPYENINALPNVYLEKPDGNKFTITPDTIYHLTFSQTSNWWQFTNGADITSIMQDNQYGRYVLTSVPTGPYSGITGLGGWGIFILYSNSIFPYRNVNLNYAATGFNTTITISNLVVPVTGPVNTKIFLTSVQGDSGIGDSLLLNGVKLSGPFNPANDFMNSEYVDYTGTALQTMGSLITKTLSQHGLYADQTLISNSNILTNTTTQAILTQQNSTDWAGVSFLGVITALNAATLNPVKKYVDKPYTSAGDTIKYTLVFSNVGSVTANNIFLIDTLPSGLTFVDNSLTLNGASYSGNITSGITVPDLPIIQTYTITFNAAIDPLATVNTEYINDAYLFYTFTPDGTTIVATEAMSNSVTTTIIDAKLTSSKAVSSTFVSVGDTITYTIVLSNTGSLNASNINFIDTIPSNATLVPSSLNQDGTPFSYNASLMTLPNGILVGGVSTITYEIIVNNDTINPIINQGNFKGDMSIAGVTIPVLTATNTVVTGIAYININVLKSVDKVYATNSITLTYTVTIVNTGNINGDSLLFIDTIPNGTTFVPNSLKVNGITQFGINPQSGINIGSITPLQVITITFDIIIN